jgi:hypothetical protein
VEQVSLAYCMFLFNYFVIFFLIYYVISILCFIYLFKNCNQIKLIYFLKFVIHEINFKIVNSKIMVLTKKEKTDITDTNMSMD